MSNDNLIKNKDAYEKAKQENQWSAIDNNDIKNNDSNHIKQEDFIEVAESLKSSISWIRYFGNKIQYDNIDKMNTEKLANILYQEELKNQHEKVDECIQQIRLLYAMYKRMNSLLRGVEAVPFYKMLNSIEEFGGLVEDIIECSIPRYIEDLNVDYNNPKDWIDFICRPDFKLEDLESGTIKFISEE